MQTRSFPQDAIPEINPLYLLRWEEIQKAHVLLYPEGVVKLNDTAAMILSRCDGVHSAREIAEQLSLEFGDDAVATSVFKFLEVSDAKGWIRVKS